MLPVGQSQAKFAPDAIKTVGKDIKSNLNGAGMKMYSTRAQDVSVSSYKKRLKALEKEIENCKRENYETFDEYMRERSYLNEQYEQIQELLYKHDADYTTINTDAQTKTIGAIGGFIKDVGTAIKTVGSDIIKTVAGLFGFSK